MKFGIIKLNTTVDKMAQIMSKSFGAANFYQMSQADFGKLDKSSNFMTKSLEIFLKTTISHSFFESSRMTSKL